MSIQKRWKLTRWYGKRWKGVRQRYWFGGCDAHEWTQFRRQDDVCEKWMTTIKCSMD